MQTLPVCRDATAARRSGVYAKVCACAAGSGDELHDAEHLSLMFTAFLGFATYKVAVVAASLSQDSSVFDKKA